MKLVAGRVSVKEDVSTALADLTTWQEAVRKQYQEEISKLLKQTERNEKENEGLVQRTQGVLAELNQYHQALRTTIY